MSCSGCFRKSPLLTFLWTATGFVFFTITWGSTDGGYHSSIPLFLFLFVYCYGASVFKQAFCGIFIANIKSNIVHLFQEEKRVFALMTSYSLLKVLLQAITPDLENSNGSPLSLVLFTILFNVIFVLPAIIQILIYVKSCVWQRSYRQSANPIREDVSTFLTVLKKWRLSIAFTFCLFLITFIFDGDISSIFRYVAKGNACWPLLIPRHKWSSLPYPLEHAWVKTWHEYFEGYKPSWMIDYCLHYGRELGEVCRLLPMLIGTYALAKLMLPPEYKLMKRALFASIAGVVMGGVASASCKIILHRYRPNAYGNPYIWTGPGTKIVNHFAFSKLDLSFPAGHTTVTTAVATCLYSTISTNCERRRSLDAWLIICLYLYPIIVLLSRVSDCYHWTSDASFGVRNTLYCIAGKVGGLAIYFNLTPPKLNPSNVAIYYIIILIIACHQINVNFLKSNFFCLYHQINNRQLFWLS